MSQQLRITFGTCDYNFKLMNESPVTRGTTEIRIMLDGISHDLIRQKNQWVSKHNNSLLGIDLAAAIGKAIELRFRI